MKKITSLFMAILMLLSIVTMTSAVESIELKTSSSEELITIGEPSNIWQY